MTNKNKTHRFQSNIRNQIIVSDIDTKMINKVKNKIKKQKKKDIQLKSTNRNRISIQNINVKYKKSKKC